jgi:hypothetical protein
MVGLTNSMLTRVRPVFGWLRDNGGGAWPEQIVKLANVTGLTTCGRFLGMELDPERKVPPTRDRLLWMVTNVERLAPVDGRRWEDLKARTANRDQVLAAHAAGRLSPGNMFWKVPRTATASSSANMRSFGSRGNAMTGFRLPRRGM